MDNPAQDISSQRLLLAIKKARAKIDRLEREPVAIVGMGCRFPGGAHDIEQFWQLLHEGRDGVVDIPPSRWQADLYYDPTVGTPDKMYVKQSAFLQCAIDQFDPQFFGLAPLEAQHLDPRQRLLLEVTWEALENAGLPADKLPTETGIFVGIIASDRDYNPNDNGVYGITGAAASVATGRLSYFLGVQGPNMAIDTACSSSLVALHLACQSLRLGECELALCGGVQLILAPDQHIALSALQALSPDGRCKTFSADANGFGRGEGCGMIVLKRLSDAVKDGDRIWAVIRSSSVNQDGRSSGLTVPNKVAQAALVRSALAKAQVEGNAISYIETHGTATKLGDPIELRALVEALGERETPLLIGSVKTNIGHLEASAGIAGVIKVALALQHQEIPPHLHFTKPSPLIDWVHLPFKIPVEPTPWLAGNQPRMAGISSFGLSGTNAHIIIAEAPAQLVEAQGNDRPCHLLCLSGKTAQTLTDQANRYLDYLLHHPALSLADVCYTANTGRVHFEHRLAVTAKDLPELQSKLRLNRVVTGSQSPAGKIAFLFTGQGSQYVDMGRELYETEPLFREIIQQCDAILRSYLTTPLLDALYPKDKGQQILDQTQYTQPALFAIEYALAKLWQSWGIEPDVLIGHSVGEYAAACLTGVFSLEDGLKLIAARGRLMQALPLTGSMVAVQMGESALAPIVQPYLNQIAIASFNAPQSLVLSGLTEAIELIISQLEGQGIKCNRLAVSHAFHSPLMEPMLGEFAQVARSITYHAPTIKLISNISGTVITDVNADYWTQHVRQPVRFAQGMATVAELGAKVFIEMGPKPTLLGLAQLSVSGGLWLPSLYPKQHSDWEQLLESLAALYVYGGSIDWRSFDKRYPRHKISLPTYPFQRQRYWLNRPARAHADVKPGHPLLGTLHRLPTSAEIHFQTTLSANNPAYLNEHRVFDQPVFPATAYLEMALAAGKAIFADNSFTLTNIIFHQPLLLTAENITVTTVFSPLADGYRWQIFSLLTSQQEWLLHSSGDMAGQSSTPPMAYQLAELQQRCPTEIPVKIHYQTCLEIGLDYGPEFQGIKQLYQGTGEALGLICLSDSSKLEADNYQLHPALLDACLQVSMTAIVSETTEAYLPFALAKVQLYARHHSVWSHAKLRAQSDSSTLTIDITLLTETGQVLAELSGLALRPVAREALQGSRLRKDWLYQLAWQPAPLPEQSPYTRESGKWLLIGDHALIQPLADLLHAQGEQVVINQPAQNEYRGVIFFGDSALTLDMPDAALETSTQALQLIQGLIQNSGQTRLWLVATAHNPSAVLWGLGRTVMWEYPELPCSCLDLDADTSAESLFEAIWRTDHENQIALHKGQRLVARLVRYQAQPEQQLTFKKNASYLITGGLGGLGLKVAAWLAEQGATHLVLCNRHGVETEAAQLSINHLESLGIKVLVVTADVSQADEVARLLATAQQFAPLRGIVHAAGLVDDATVLQQTPARFATVFAPKVSGSWYLHQLSQAMPLDFFVCFSSAASLLGNGGQANYAAANVFMDALMQHRHALGLPGLSINWGGWSDVGLAAKLSGLWGAEAISPEQGTALLGHLLRQSTPQVGVLPFNWTKLGKLLPAGYHLPVLTQFLKPTSISNTLRQQLSQATVDQRIALLNKHLRAEIQTIVGVEPTGGQSFLDIGMDSLMSIQLSTRLAASLETSLPATLTLEYRTIEQLTTYLANLFSHAESGLDYEQRIQSIPRDRVMPLSFVQQKVWTRQQANPLANLFNLSVGVRLEGSSNLDWLTQAVQTVGQRHEILRTTFHVIDGVVIPQVLATSTGNLINIDFSHLPEPTQSDETHRLTVETTQAPFNLTEQPPWKVVLIKLGAEKHLFVLCMHHIIMDAWSMALFFNEVTAHYKAFSEGLPTPLPPLAIQYADFAYWQRHYFTAERLASRLAYWQQYLAKAPPLLALPTDKPRPSSGQFFPSNVERFRLSVGLSQQVKAYGQRTGATPFTTLLAAYMTLLSQRTGSSQIAAISPVNKRNSPGLEPLIGHFSEMAILWIDLSGHPSFETLQQRVYETVLEAIKQQDVPLEQVVDSLLSGENLTKDLPYRVLFNLVPPPDNVLKLPGVQAKTIGLDEAEHVKMIVDLALIMWEENENDALSLAGWLRYRTDLFEAQTIRNIIADFEALLTKACA